MRDVTAFGVELWAFADARAVLEEVQLVERLGYASVWLADTQLLAREVYVLMGAVAALTARVQLGIGVTNPVTRHPTVTASAMVTLQEAAGQRVLLGVGAGSSAVRLLGEAPVGLARLADWVGQVRALASGEPVQGPSGQWRLAFGGAGLCPPILIAGRGPKILRLAGALADGAIIAGGARADARLRAMLDCVRAGRAADPSPARPFKTCLHLPAAVHRDRRMACAAVRPQVASVLKMPHWPLSPAAEQAGQQVQAAYDYSQHLGTRERWADLIPDSIVPEFALAGTPDECVAELRGLVALGFDEITLAPYAAADGTRADMTTALWREVVERL